MLLKLVNIKKSFGEGEARVEVLKGIDLEIKKGEYISLVGPSGSGKSTLMYLMGLLDKPSSGEIFIEGRSVVNLNDEEISALRNRFIGFVFQQFNLIPKLTVFENVILPYVYSREKGKDIKKRAEELLTYLGIWEKRNNYPNELSGGQQQRTAIARALIMEPELILADEPTGNLDTKTGGEIIKILEELNKKGKTVIIVTHDPSIAKRAKRRIKIKDGKIYE